MFIDIVECFIVFRCVLFIFIVPSMVDVAVNFFLIGGLWYFGMGVFFG